MSGDPCYFTLDAPDADRAKKFFGELFDWTFSSGSAPEGFNIEGPNPPGGIAGGSDEAKISLYFEVNDLDASIDKVRGLGGSADGPHQAGPGIFALCTDDQGIEFALFEFETSPN